MQTEPQAVSRQKANARGTQRRFLACLFSHSTLNPLVHGWYCMLSPVSPEQRRHFIFFICFPELSSVLVINWLL